MRQTKYTKVFLGALPKCKKESLNSEHLENLNRASEIALGVLAVLGVATIAVVAPNLLQALDKLFFRKHYGNISDKSKQRKTIAAFYYLKRKGLIRFKKDRGGFKIFLTKLGKEKADKLHVLGLKIPKTKKWDGKWWQVAADIPTLDHRSEADRFRRKVKEMGFYPLQKTLWFYPFDPRKEIEFVSREYGIANYVTVMEINRLDVQDEKLLTVHFKKISVL